MNDRIRQMKEEIEKRGGSVYFPQDVPDDILEHFLEEVLACPYCAVASGENPTVRARRKTAGGH